MRASGVTSLTVANCTASISHAPHLWVAKYAGAIPSLSLKIASYFPYSGLHPWTPTASKAPIMAPASPRTARRDGLDST